MTSPLPAAPGRAASVVLAPAARAECGARRPISAAPCTRSRKSVPPRVPYVLPCGPGREVPIRTPREAGGAAVRARSPGVRAQAASTSDVRSRSSRASSMIAKLPPVICEP
eukprot:4439606-Prymnesium_polylepis.5